MSLRPLLALRVLTSMSAFYIWLGHYISVVETEFGVKLTGAFHIPFSAFINFHIIFDIDLYFPTMCAVVKHDLYENKDSECQVKN